MDQLSISRLSRPMFVFGLARRFAVCISVLAASAGPTTVAEEWQNKAATLGAYADNQALLLSANERVSVAPSMAIACCITRKYEKSLEWLRQTDDERRKAVMGVLVKLEVGLQRDKSWLRDSKLVDSDVFCMMLLRDFLAFDQFSDAQAQVELISSMSIKDDAYMTIAMSYAVDRRKEDAHALLSRIANVSKRQEVQKRVDSIVATRRSLQWEDFFQRGTSTCSYFDDYGVDFGLYRLQSINNNDQFQKLLSEAQRDLDRLRLCGMYGAQGYSRRQFELVELAVRDGVAIVEKMSTRGAVCSVRRLRSGSGPRPLVFVVNLDMT